MDNLRLIDGHFWLKNSSYYDIQQLVILNTYYLILNFLWLIDDHFWPKKNHSWQEFFLSHSQTFMTISKRGAQKHSWTFMAHWWSFLTKRKKSFMTRKNFCLIDDHFWPKKHPYAACEVCFYCIQKPGMWIRDKPSFTCLATIYHPEWDEKLSKMYKHHRSIPP